MDTHKSTFIVHQEKKRPPHIFFLVSQGYVVILREPDRDRIIAKLFALHRIYLACNLFLDILFPPRSVSSWKKYDYGYFFLLSLVSWSPVTTPWNFRANTFFGGFNGLFYVFWISIALPRVRQWRGIKKGLSCTQGSSSSMFYVERLNTLDFFLNFCWDCMNPEVFFSTWCPHILITS